MVRGYPDYQSPAGRSISGALVNTTTFSGAIPSDETGNIDLDTVDTGEQHSFIQLDISCPDDTAIHRVQLQRLSDGWVFFENRFVMAANFPINSDLLAAGEQGRLIVTNKAEGSVTFSGALSWVVREI